ncbi:hypothetical protein [Niallia sp. 01092]|uniref:hypothetical protein n=1 Tax=unclassified Niallia TaxID=2837522 RepID=UPI003FD22F96
MTRQNLIKGVVLTTSLAVLGSSFAPVSSAFAAETNQPITSTSTEVQTGIETPESLIEYIEEEKAIQEEILEEDLSTEEFLSAEVPSDVQDTKDFIQYATTTDEFQVYIGEEVDPNQGETAEASGVIGGTLKGIKAFGWICRVGGKTLKYAIKPLSPSKAKLVDHYARKIAYATERLESGTKGALIKALEKAGVPGKSAQSLAEIILWLI